MAPGAGGDPPWGPPGAVTHWRRYVNTPRVRKPRERDDPTRADRIRTRREVSLQLRSLLESPIVQERVLGQREIPPICIHTLH